MTNRPELFILFEYLDRWFESHVGYEYMSVLWIASGGVMAGQTVFCEALHVLCVYGQDLERI
jgi:hypothetical protein